MKQSRGSSLLLGLLYAAVLALWTVKCAEGKSGPDPDEPWNPLPCKCSDVDIRKDFTGAQVDYSCWEQSGYEGVCNQGFIFDAVEEMSEGYCQISCGRCPCCPTLEGVLKDKGLDMFQWMLSFTEHGNHIKRPGYMAVLLAPKNDAVWDAMKKMGYYSKWDVEKSADAKQKMGDLAKYHVLPPLADTKAVWTTPFMPYSEIETALQARISWNSKLYVPQFINSFWDDYGYVWLTSPKSKAKIVERDIYACKGYVNILDTALMQ